jgi:hypothetical protein
MPSKNSTSDGNLKRLRTMIDANGFTILATNSKATKSNMLSMSNTITLYTFVICKLTVTSLQ